MDHGEPWSGKRKGFGEADKMVVSLKSDYKTLLTFFNKDIEMF